MKLMNNPFAPLSKNSKPKTLSFTLNCKTPLNAIEKQEDISNMFRHYNFEDKDFKVKVNSRKITGWLRCNSGIDAKNIRLCVIDMFKEFRIPKTEYEIEIG